MIAADKIYDATHDSVQLYMEYNTYNYTYNWHNASSIGSMVS